MNTERANKSTWKGMKYMTEEKEFSKDMKKYIYLSSRKGQVSGWIFEPPIGL